MKGVSVSIPEPPPIPNGEVVPDVLINYLVLFQKEHLPLVPTEARDPFLESMADLISLIHQRDAFGRAKYGQPLMTQDGRNGIEDAKQELGDLLQYIMKCKLAGETVSDGDRRMFTTALIIIKQLLK